MNPVDKMGQQMKDDFTEDELTVFKCFINPKYPMAVRTMASVVKETGFTKDKILCTFAQHHGLLFKPYSKTKWAFNLVFFMAKYHEKYPELFKEFSIKTSSVGLVMVPASKSEAEIEAILQQVIDDPQQPKALCNLVKSVAKANKALAQAQPGRDADVLSFAM